MCVTPIEIIDKAVAVAARPEVIFCSFVDMLRVPGSQKDLLKVKSEGDDVRVVCSPKNIACRSWSSVSSRWTSSRAC